MPRVTILCHYKEELSFYIYDAREKNNNNQFKTQNTQN
jgi:hypothetical protein